MFKSTKPNLFLSTVDDQDDSLHLIQDDIIKQKTTQETQPNKTNKPGAFKTYFNQLLLVGTSAIIATTATIYLAPQLLTPHTTSLGNQTEHNLKSIYDKKIAQIELLQENLNQKINNLNTGLTQEQEQIITNWMKTFEAQLYDYYNNHFKQVNDKMIFLDAKFASIDKNKDDLSFKQFVDQNIQNLYKKLDTLTTKVDSTPKVLTTSGLYKNTNDPALNILKAIALCDLLLKNFGDLGMNTLAIIDTLQNIVNSSQITFKQVDYNQIVSNLTKLRYKVVHNIQTTRKIQPSPSSGLSNILSNFVTIEKTAPEQGSTDMVEQGKNNVVYNNVPEIQTLINNIHKILYGYLVYDSTVNKSNNQGFEISNNKFSVNNPAQLSTDNPIKNQSEQGTQPTAVEEPSQQAKEDDLFINLNTESKSDTSSQETPKETEVPQPIINLNNNDSKENL